MLQFTNVIPARTRPATYTPAEAVMAGSYVEGYQFLWCATARTSTKAQGLPSTPSPQDESTRTATTCFMRGLKERVEISTNDGLPWQWRRIVFTMKGLWPLITAADNFAMNTLTSNGYRRVINEIYGNNKLILNTYLFTGVRDTDWNDEISAPIDTRRVTVLYDRVMKIASGNESGVMRTYNMWHPFNKNLVYDDDEDGGGENSSPYSVSSKAGMGDVYVMDFFRPRTGSSATSRLAFGPNATLYWHEK